MFVFSFYFAVSQRRLIPTLTLIILHIPEISATEQSMTKAGSASLIGKNAFQKLRLTNKRQSATALKIDAYSKSCIFIEVVVLLTSAYKYPSRHGI
jgi:hypothetical protein